MTKFAKLIAVPALLGAALILIPAVALAAGFAEDDDATGTIALRATEVQGLALASEGMMPGDSVTGAVELRNEAGGELRFSVSTSAVDGATAAAGLSTVLVVTVRTADTGEADGDPCDENSGAVVRARAVLDAAGQLVGDSSPGDDFGDRTLAGHAGEILCFTVELPITAGNEFQGLSSTISFEFTSEATANNP